MFIINSQNTGAVAMLEAMEVDHSMKEGGDKKLEHYQERMEHTKVVSHSVTEKKGHEVRSS